MLPDILKRIALAAVIALCTVGLISNVVDASPPDEPPPWDEEPYACGSQLDVIYNPQAPCVVVQSEPAFQFQGYTCPLGLSQSRILGLRHDHGEIALAPTYANPNPGNIEHPDQRIEDLVIAIDFCVILGEVDVCPEGAEARVVDNQLLCFVGEQPTPAVIVLPTPVPAPTPSVVCPDGTVPSRTSTSGAPICETPQAAPAFTGPDDGYGLYGDGMGYG